MGDQRNAIPFRVRGVGSVREVAFYSHYGPTYLVEKSYPKHCVVKIVFKRSIHWRSSWCVRDNLSSKQNKKASKCTGKIT